MTPAEQHLFLETPPDRIFLDTSFVVATLVAGDPRHKECLSFAEGLQSAGTVVVYSTMLRLADDLLHRFLAQFRRAEIRLSQRVVSLAIELVGRFDLQSYDAVQVASTLDAGCADMASLDGDFRRVDGIHLWNNRQRR